MKRMSIIFVALARSAKHESLLHHYLGDRDLEAHCGQLVREYMNSARRAKACETRVVS